MDRGLLQDSMIFLGSADNFIKVNSFGYYVRIICSLANRTQYFLYATLFFNSASKLLKFFMS